MDCPEKRNWADSAKPSCDKRIGEMVSRARDGM
jgi:hypothetical protein